jgi:hypothetical protein
MDKQNPDFIKSLVIDGQGHGKGVNAYDFAWSIAIMIVSGAALLLHIRWKRWL